MNLRETACGSLKPLKKQINDIEAILAEKIQHKHLKQQSVQNRKIYGLLR